MYTRTDMRKVDQTRSNEPMPVKCVTIYSCALLRQMLVDFQNSFTLRLISKFTTKSLKDLTALRNCGYAILLKLPAF